MPHLRSSWACVALLFFWCQVSLQTTTLNSGNGYTFNTTVRHPSGTYPITVHVTHITLPLDDIPEDICNASPLEGFNVVIEDSGVDLDAGIATLQLPYDPLKLALSSHPDDVHAYWRQSEGDYLEYPSSKVQSNLIIAEWPVAHQGVFITALPCTEDHLNSKRGEGLPSLPQHPNPTLSHTTGLDLFGEVDASAQIEVMPMEVSGAFGTVNSHLDIKVPPGRLGMEPKLSISYDSSSGNGWLGLRWDISGLSSITVNPTKGAPLYNAVKDTEKYIIDGDVIAKGSGDSDSRGPNDRFYRMAENTFDIITRVGTCPSNCYWTVTSKSGVTSYYGKYSSDRLGTTSDDNTNIFMWMLSEVKDLNNNLIKYHYTKVSSSKGNSVMIYPSKITYTGQYSTEGPYSVTFNRRSSTRDDARINCIYGRCLIDDQLLENIQVAYSGATIRTYAFDYIIGTTSQRNLLSKITEKGESGGTLGDYDMEYIDNGMGYESSTSWNTGNDNIKSGAHPMPLLGGTTYIGGGWHLFIGVAWVLPDKRAAVGGAVAGTYGHSNGKTELIDLNGDGLPDKAFLKDGKLKFRPNLGGTQNKFSDHVCETNVDDFFHEFATTTSVGADGYWYVIQASIQSIFSTMDSDTYFSDVNGDMIMDVVLSNSVHFGYRYGNDGCVNYDTDSRRTEVPLGDGPTPNVGAALDEARDIISPNYTAAAMLDTVKTWTAPYSGFVTVDFGFKCTKVTGGKESGVRAAVQFNAQEQWSYTWAAPSSTSRGSSLSLNVHAGDRIYFRSGTVALGAGGVAELDASITYPFYAGRSDANAFDISSYDAQQDFVLIGNGFSALGINADGSVSVQGSLHKPYNTTDDLRIEIYKNGWMILSKDIDRNDTGSFELTTPFTVAANDSVWVQISTDSQIDPTGISYEPVVMYTDGSNNFTILSSLDTYNLFLNPTGEAPSKWVATSNTSLSLTAAVELTADATNGTFILDWYNIAIVVKSKGILIGKTRFNILSNSNLTINVTAGEEYFFEVTCNRDLTPIVSSYELNVTSNGNSIAVPHKFYIQYNNTLFPNPYRGWTQVSYDSVGMEEEPIDENRFNIVLPDPEDEDAAYNPTAYAMYPSYSKNRWDGSGSDTYLTNKELASSKLGPSWPGASSPSATARKKRSEWEKTAPSKYGWSWQVGGYAGAILGPASLGLAASGGRAYGNVDYFDMNADGFPDVVRTDGIQYTNPDTGVFMDEIEVDVGTVHETSVNSIGPGGSVGVSKKTNSKGRVHVSGAVLPQIGISLALGYQRGFNRELKQIFDINGDGLPDKCKFAELFGTTLRCNLNLGYSFSSDTIDFDGVEINKGTSDTLDGGLSGGVGDGIAGWAVGVSSSTTWNRVEHVLFDINGDGLPDALYMDDSKVKVRLNTGTGFGSERQWGDIEAYLKRMDFSIGGGGFFQIPIFVGVLLPIWVVVNPGAFVMNTESKVNEMLEDINGDGFPDFLSSDDSDDLQVRLSKIADTDYLKSITSPLGFKATATYQRAGNTAQMPQNYYVAKTVSNSDGTSGVSITESWVFTEGINDPKDFNFLGFTTASKSIMRGTQRELKEEYFYCVGNYSCRGKPLTITQYGPQDSSKYFEHKFQYKTFTTSDSHETYFTGLVGEVASHFEGTSTARVSQTFEYDYDEVGNMKYLHYSGDSAGKDIEVHMNYSSQDASCGVLNKPISMVQSSQGKTFRKTENSVLCSTGNFMSTTVYLEDGSSAVSTMTYFSNGNLQQWQAPANYRGQKYTTTYTYDSAVNTHIASITDSYGYSSSTTYNAKYGAPIDSIDANNQKTSYFYDQFGRVTRMIGPMEQGTGVDTVTYDYYTSDSDSPARAKATYTDRLRAGGGTLQTCTFIDGFSRVIQEKVEASIYENNVEKRVVIVSGRQIWDELGRVVRSYYPTYEDFTQLTTYTVSNLIGTPMEMTYDPLGRVLQTTTPALAISTSAYGFGMDHTDTYRLLTTTKDPVQNEVRTTHTYNGDLTSIQQVWKTQTIWTKYTYDAMNQQTANADDGGYTNTYRYDMLGRMIEQNLVNTGTTKFSYDMAGNMLSKVTSNLEGRGAINYEYNFLQNVAVTFPFSPQNNINYTYGAPGASFNRAGKLYYIVDASGTETLYFDQLGREKTSMKTAIRKGYGADQVVGPYNTTTTFDTWGRPWSIVYPDGEILRYTYDKGGKQNTATGTKGTATNPYVTETRYDKFGHVVYMKYGNNVVVTRTYDALTTWVQNKKVVAPSQTLTDINFSYDKAGRVTEMKNNAPVAAPGKVGGPSIHTFKYDELNRVVGSEQNYQSSSIVNFTYSLEHKFNNLKALINKYQLTTRVDKLYNSSASAYYNSISKLPDHSFNITYLYTTAYPHMPIEIQKVLLSNNTEKLCIHYDSDGNLVNYGSTLLYGTAPNANPTPEDWELVCAAWDHGILTNTYPPSPYNFKSRNVTWFDDDKIAAIYDSVTGDKVRFAYDHEGRRTNKLGGRFGESVYVSDQYVLERENHMKYIFFNGERIAAKSVNGSNTLCGFQYPAPAQGVDCQYFFTKSEEGDTHWITGVLGAPLAHYEYSPTGEVWVSEVFNTNVAPNTTPQKGTPYKDQDMELDETGLYYSMKGYMDPALGIPYRLGEEAKP